MFKLMEDRYFRLSKYYKLRWKSYTKVCSGVFRNLLKGYCNITIPIAIFIISL